MKYLFFAITSLVSIIAQMIAGKSFFLFDFLDFPLILIAYWALYRSRVQALFVGSITGLLMDAALGWPLGYNGFGKTLAAYLIAAADRRFNLEGVGIRSALIATASTTSSLSIFALFAVLQRAASENFLAASLMQGVITGIASSLVFSVVDAYQRARANKMS